LRNPSLTSDVSMGFAALYPSYELGWFVGQVMKSSGGKANPQAVNDLLKTKLGL
jgi:Asp-tRNA(Asn)/Glu-tRNA(Gln) amidotransferase B subunit